MKVNEHNTGFQVRLRSLKLTFPAPTFFKMVKNTFHLFYSVIITKLYFKIYTIFGASEACHYEKIIKMNFVDREKHITD